MTDMNNGFKPAVYAEWMWRDGTQAVQDRAFTRMEMVNVELIPSV